jgi:hypothetical protein
MASMKAFASYPPCPHHKQATFTILDERGTPQQSRRFGYLMVSPGLTTFSREPKQRLAVDLFHARTPAMTQDKSKPAPLETGDGEQKDDNLDDLGRKPDGSRQEQPGKAPPSKTGKA